MYLRFIDPLENHRSGSTLIVSFFCSIAGIGSEVGRVQVTQPILCSSAFAVIRTPYGQGLVSGTLLRGMCPHLLA